MCFKLCVLPALKLYTQKKRNGFENHGCKNINVLNRINKREVLYLPVPCRGLETDS